MASFTVRSRAARLMAASLALAAFLCLVRAGPAPAGEFRLRDLRSIGANDWLRMYNICLPVLLHHTRIAPLKDENDKVREAVAFINFQSNPGMYEEYFRYGYNGIGGWISNLSLRLVSGNIYCSEQSYMAALMLEPEFPLSAFRDVKAHTFHEVPLSHGWAIVDPMFDMRIPNAQGRAARYGDVLDYLSGNASALALPPEPSPRTRAYLERFRPGTYTPKRHAPGDHVPRPRQNYDVFVDMPVPRFLALLESKGYDPSKGLQMAYMEYVRNNVNAMLERSPDPNATARAVQDFFLDRIQEQWRGAEPFGRLHRARNLQALGRLDQALALLDTMGQTPRIKHFKAQIYYLKHDADAFNALAPALADNIFYRHMYWKLNGSPLRPQDPEIFVGFPYRQE